MPKGPSRFYAPGPFAEGALVVLAGEEARHARARRLKPGDRVRLLDGAGGGAEGHVAAIARGRIEIVTEKLLDGEGEPPAPIALYASAIRMPRLSWLVEKAVEAGATRVVVADSERAQADRLRLAGRERERLSRLAREAAKQCGRSSSPSIEGPVAFGAALAESSEPRILLDPSGEDFPESLEPAPSALWVGPEGGFTAEELARAREAGWRIARLPAATLRAETAAVAGLILLRRAFDSVRRRAQNTSVLKP